MLGAGCHRRVIETQARPAGVDDDDTGTYRGSGDPEIKQALRRARIWDWVAGLPKGLDTMVGEPGRGLSGGRGQRIVLARALLAAGPCWCSTSRPHLDPHTAGELIADVSSAAREQSVLLITLRTEGLELVDRVFRWHLPGIPNSIRHVTTR